MSVDKIRIIWICHFSNKEIREKIFLLKQRVNSDFAPWITNMIKGFEKRPDVDLHIISPHKGMTRLIQQFGHNGLFYHFFKPDLPIVHRKWPRFFPLDKWTQYIKNRIIVYFMVKRIKPDIICLIGAENPYYSLSILWLKKFNIPIYIIIQGILSDPNIYSSGKKPDVISIGFERKIHREFKYFGIGAPFFCDLIKRDNPAPIFLGVQMPRAINIAPNNLDTTKEYDFVFFGRLDQSKGIEDLLEALLLVKNYKSDVTLNVIGLAGKKYFYYLKQMSRKLGILNNVTFSGYLPTINDVHKEALKAKYYVLPTRVEGMASSIIECMLLGLPVITCRTGGLPYLNKDGITILMSEPGDVRELAKNMIKIIQSPKLAEELSNKAKEFAIKEFSIEKITDTYLKQFKAIIKNYHYGTPIPEELLFYENDFKH